MEPGTVWAMSDPDPSASECVSTCPVCAERYDQRRRRPKLLGCGHTFCLSCLMEISGRGGLDADVREIRCPLCRRATDLPGQGVTDLADNFAVIGFACSSREGSGGGPRGRCDRHPEENIGHFCICRLSCPCCAPKHKSQIPHHNIEGAESAGEKIRFALDYCEEKQMLLDKLLQDWAYERRQVDVLRSSLERQANAARDTELLSQVWTLMGLRDGVPPKCPRPVLSGTRAPATCWSFASPLRADRENDDIERSGTFLLSKPGPDGPYPPGPVNSQWLGKDGGEKGVVLPVGVAVTPGGIVLVTDHGGQWVRVLDLYGNHRMALQRGWVAEAGVGLLAGACAGVAVSSLGYLVVLARPGSRCVSAHSRDGRRLFSLQLGWHHPFGVAITAKRQLVVSDCCERGTLSILTVDWTSGGILHLQRIRGLRCPSFLACSHCDNAIVVSTSGSVHLYDITGTLIWRSGSEQGIVHPTGVAFDSEHNVIVADHGSGRVVLLSRDGRLLKCVIHGLAGPQGLALSPRGILLIADHGTSKLLTQPYQPTHTPSQLPFID
ncbi:hypothetical protein AGOR_G00111290 [Albula goreensis]|uniref:RING-type E3 ubiquitin transferase n=1 Tax=Albula goreensis TaxID=1534307 RepID=A0A8T3DLH5_9TELE|nr:hypothetical protein AGOR_G00111290 [Albula goreensis]